MKLLNSRWGILLYAGLCCTTFTDQGKLLEDPPGEFFPLQAKDHLNATSFKTGRPVVGPTYFYWYDIETGSHIFDGDLTVSGTGSWKTAEFALPDCRFMNRCNSADFRFVIPGGDLELAVRRVFVKRTKQVGEKQ